MKKANDNNIKTTAVNLIEAADGGSTTTLDVKKAVRALGFQCDQEDVSRVLDGMYAAGEVNRSHDPAGFYRYRSTQDEPVAQIRPDVLASIVTLVAEMKEVDVNSLSADSSLVGLGFDSLDAVELTMKVEAVLDVVIPDEQVVNMTTIGDFALFVTGLKVSAPVDQSVPDAPAPAASASVARYPMNVPQPTPAGFFAPHVGKWQAQVSRRHAGAYSGSPVFLIEAAGRDEARAAYAKLANVRRDHVRARIVRA